MSVFSSEQQAVVPGAYCGGQVTTPSRRREVQGEAWWAHFRFVDALPDAGHSAAPAMVVSLNAAILGDQPVGEQFAMMA